MNFIPSVESVSFMDGLKKIDLLRQADFVADFGEWGMITWRS